MSKRRGFPNDVGSTGTATLAGVRANNSAVPSRRGSFSVGAKPAVPMLSEVHSVCVVPAPCSEHRSRVGTDSAPQGPADRKDTWRVQARTENLNADRQAMFIGTGWDRQRWKAGQAEAAEKMDHCAKID